jgi:hypothetical protein
MTLHPDDRMPELSTTRHRDYILTPYTPSVDPTGRAHAASLLRHALRREDLGDAWPLCEALRAHLGADQTVWGFKHGPSGFSVELYFYNFVENAASNPASACRLAEVLAPWLAFEGAVDESLPYFMCSVELSREVLDRGRTSPWRLYLRTGDVHRTECGFSYRAEARDRLVLENHYWFYRASDPRELEDALRRIQRSPRSGSKRCWSTLFPKGLRDCFTVCYAVKPHADGLYYSRVGSEALVGFLRAHAGGAYVDVLASPDFAHARWDLGFDFCAPPGAPHVTLPKYAIHGVF